MYDETGYDGDGGGDDGGALSAGDGGGNAHDAEIFSLRCRLLEYESTISGLWAQLRAQKDMVAQLQDRVMAAPSDEGPRVRPAPECGDDPLLIAARCGDAGALELLLGGAGSACCDKREEGKKRLALALLLACQHGHADAADVLLRAGADVDADRGCPLIWAATIGHVGIARLLLDHGADVGALNGCALRAAVSAGHLGVVAEIVRQR